MVGCVERPFCDKLVCGWFRYITHNGSYVLLWWPPAHPDILQARSRNMPLVSTLCTSEPPQHPARHLTVTAPQFTVCTQAPDPHWICVLSNSCLTDLTISRNSSRRWSRRRSSNISICSLYFKEASSLVVEIIAPASEGYRVEPWPRVHLYVCFRGSSTSRVDTAFYPVSFGGKAAGT
jgi:hypothetical protein